MSTDESMECFEQEGIIVRALKKPKNDAIYNRKHRPAGLNYSRKCCRGGHFSIYNKDVHIFLLSEITDQELCRGECYSSGSVYSVASYLPLMRRFLSCLGVNRRYSQVELLT